MIIGMPDERPNQPFPERDDEDFNKLMAQYREARDDEDDAASRASSLAQEIEDKFGVDAEGER
jgi:hypothetical protein